VKQKGWAIAPEFGQAHTLTRVSKSPVKIAVGAKLAFSIEQLAKNDFATLGRFLFYTTSDRAPRSMATPRRRSLPFSRSRPRSSAMRARGTHPPLPFGCAVLASERAQLASLKKQLEELKPYTIVPILRELAGDKRRTTRLQHRGNYLDVGEEVAEALPAAFQVPSASNTPNRLPSPVGWWTPITL